MGPRPRGRGDFVTDAYHASKKSLQWGRAHVDAEIR